MATSFINRWSKRKLEKTNEHLVHKEEKLTQAQVIPPNAQNLFEDNLEQVAPITNHNTEITDPRIKQIDLEELPLSQLLISNASESLKKAALRKLFLSEEFNVRDGLNEYDEDFTNIKTLSKEVAQNLREWIKDEIEEQVDNSHCAENKIVNQQQNSENEEQTISMQTEDQELNSFEDNEKI